MAELGPVDMLVNSAGISVPGEFDTLTIDQFRVSVKSDFGLNCFILQIENVQIVTKSVFCCCGIKLSLYFKECITKFQFQV